MDNQTQRRPSTSFLYSNTRWIMLGGAFASTIIFFLLLWSLETAYSTDKRQLARQHTPVIVDDGIQLDVVYPQHLLLNTDPVALVVGLRMSETAVLTSPLLITLDTPPSIAISGTVQGKRVLATGNASPTTIWLLNTAVLPSNQLQTVTLTHSLTKTLTLLDIEVESPATAARRQIMTGVLSDKGPLVLAVSAIVSIAALVLLEYQRQREREKEDRETKETELQKEQKQREHILTHINDLREHLIQVNPEGVKRIWQSIGEGKIPIPEAWVPAVELGWLTNLKQLSLRDQNSKPPEEWVKELQREWPAELVGALICAEEEVKQNKETYRPIFPQIPLTRVTNAHLRDRFLRLWLEVDGTTLQDLVQETKIAADTPINSSQFDRSFTSIEFQDPFAHIRAENEETSLYSDEIGGFYSGVALFNNILAARENQLICGSVGCGRTATAKGALLKGPLNNQIPQYWIYKQIYNLPELTENTIIELLVHNLLDYIIQKPTLLTKFQDEQRILLAITLSQTLTSDFIRAELAQARRGKSWSNTATLSQSPIWSQVGETQLQLVSDAIESITVSRQIPQEKMLLAVTHCFQSFGFQKIRLLLDFAGNTREQVQRILPHFAKWEEGSIISTLFIPEAVYEKNESSVGHLQTNHLTWQAKDLRKLAEHRFENISKASDPFIFFENETVYDRFFDVNIKTPRQLFHLWQAALSFLDPANPIINDTILDQAIASSSKQTTSKSRPR